MEQMNMSPRQQELYKRLARIPQKILALYDTENIADFVLHELCGDKCLNFSKAAYFIDNPDFDCFKGIGGYDNAQQHVSSEFIWSDVPGFHNHLNNCEFNKNVRNFYMPSIRLSSSKNNGHHKQELDEKAIAKISNDLGFSKPHYYIWKMKHDNHGVIIFQPSTSNGDLNIDEDVLASLCILGFCPIY